MAIDTPRIFSTIDRESATRRFPNCSPAVAPSRPRRAPGHDRPGLARGARMLIAVLWVLAVATSPVAAIKLPKVKIGKGGDVGRKVLTGLGIGLLIDQLAGPLNDFINTLMMNNGAANRDATKVVPIITVGQGVEVGAAQVSGPEAQVKAVKAVIAINATFDKGRRLEVRALIPSGSKNPLQLQRVYGVGVTAIIDYHL